MINNYNLPKNIKRILAKHIKNEGKQHEALIDIMQEIERFFHDYLA